MKEKRTITHVQAKKIIDSEENIIILDVREEEEFKKKHIYGAKLIPLNLLEITIEKEIPCKETKILIYCFSGKRSFKALEILISKGYSNVYNFGGIKDWPFDVVM